MDEGYDGFDDALDAEEYAQWQRECLTEMMRVTEPDGAIFYNHHWKTKDGLLIDRADIMKGFPVRQIIIWWRKIGVNFNPGYFLPTYEVIYLIAKPKFKMAKGANSMGSVWKIMPEARNLHPAPFPVEIPKRCIIAAGRGPILDPFAGSGTTGVAAKMLGFDFVGIERSEEYCAMARQRIDQPVNNDLFQRGAS